MSAPESLGSRRLAGKRVLVTGAGSGIGRAAAIRFAAEGALVALVDRGEDGLREVERTVADPTRTLMLTADVSDESAIREAVQRADAAFGGLDVVVANAGIHFDKHAERVHEFDLGAWSRTIEVNLTGVFLTCKHAIPALLRSGGGSIICTGSPTGLRGSENLGAYSASKAGVMALVRVIAAEYAADGIRANSVVPGFTDTSLVQVVRDDPELRQTVEDRIPLHRAARPEEIASMMVFLASDESCYATGAMFVVDGGRTAV